MNLVFMQPRNSYRKEVFTDPSAGDIIVYTPILEDGTQDPMRMPVFKGETLLNRSDGRQFKVEFKLLKAVDLRSAFEEWGTGLEAAIHELETQSRKQAILDAANTPNGKVIVP